MKTKKKKRPVQYCLHPTCKLTARTRGQCNSHYNTFRSYVRAGKASEADAMARGLLLPKGTGGNDADDHEIFLLGCERTGRGV